MRVCICVCVCVPAHTHAFVHVYAREHPHVCEDYIKIRYVRKTQNLSCDMITDQTRPTRLVA